MPGFDTQQLLEQSLNDGLEHYHCINNILAAMDEEDKKQKLFNSRDLLNKRLIQYSEKLDKIKKQSKPDPPEDQPPPSRVDEWQDDIKRFARDGMNIDLLDHQVQLCESDARVNMMIAGRGAGKSVAARVKALYNTIMYERHVVIVVSSGQRMSCNFGEDLCDALRESTLSPFVKTIGKTQVSFHNGSIIRFLPANSDTIRGYHPKHHNKKTGLTVILDEACFMEQGDEIRKAVEYMLITTSGDHGKIYIVTSPSATGSWVHTYAQDAKDPAANTAVIQCPSHANPNIPPEEIERLKATKNELEFRAEVLGEWVDGAFGLFNGLIEPAIIPAAELTDPLPPGAITTLGVDLALSFDATHDKNALAVLAKWQPEDDEEPRYRLLAVEILSRASDNEVRGVLKRVVGEHNISSVVIEQYQGKALAEYCQRLNIDTELIAPTASVQQMVFHELHRLLRLGLLQLPGTLPDQFFAELRAFEYRRESNGRVSFGHPHGSNQHDDSVYALAWSLYAAQQLDTAPRYDPPAQIRFIPKV